MYFTLSLKLVIFKNTEKIWKSKNSESFLHSLKKIFDSNFDYNMINCIFFYDSFIIPASDYL